MPRRRELDVPRSMPNQAAVAQVNARLYEAVCTFRRKLETRVQERTKERHDFLWVA